ncbi:MAG: Spx/MgsR family RNA polymerase-binding regulatory protein [Pseudomonadota bacterium]|nr:Spx/MgsR family RNA polymerase-binding regulatory protein [Pseudomonadota bacterium]
MTTNLYGIPTCDSVRKARKWLTYNGIDHQFIDLRENTPPKAKIDHWVTSLGAAKMVNKRSTTWKNMSDEDRNEAETGDTAAVLLANPTLIKRPVLEYGDILDVGFSVDAYNHYFQQ